MCDIDNPPYGEQGAAAIFAPQKGATNEQVVLLDQGVQHICEVIHERLDMDVSELKGGGAAGAMGAGMVAFFGASLQMGIDTVLQTVKFEEKIQNADVVFTGEGKMDNQSLRGKVVMGIARRAKAFSVPVIAVVGGVEGDIEEAYAQGVSAVFSINRMPQDFSISAAYSAENLAFAMQNILRLYYVENIK
jgi:glycerate kinase